jgi:hypothetical protein
MGSEPDSIDWGALRSRETRVVYVDVDDTLVRSFGAKRIRVTTAIERVRALHAAGFELYCGSTGGAEYCRTTAAELGLFECFVAYLPKPQLLLDDQHPSEWRSLRWAHPNAC